MPACFLKVSTEVDMKYKHLFFDLDHTIWDFDANSRVTLADLYEEFNLYSIGVTDFEQFYLNYLEHNERLWARYRNGYIKVDELRWKRMWLTLLDFRIGNQDIAKRMGQRFLEMLPNRTILFDYAKEILLRNSPFLPGSDHVRRFQQPETKEGDLRLCIHESRRAS
jgi:FMN phosphatase YigB (HAD superfamily)